MANETLLGQADRCRQAFLSACGQGGERADIRNNFSMDGVGPGLLGALVGYLAWHWMSGAMLRNFGDTGLRKMVGNVLPVPIALAAGIFTSHLTQDVGEKGFSVQAFTEAASETGATVSNWTGIGQPTFTRIKAPDGAGGGDNWMAIPPAPQSAAPAVPGAAPRPVIMPPRLK